MTAKRPFSLFLLVACSLLTFSSCSPALTVQGNIRSGNNSQVTLTSSAKPVQEVKCKNEQGKDVDWFIVYKLPKNKSSSNELVRQGLAYAFLLPTNQHEQDLTHENKLEVKVEVKIGSSGKEKGHGRYFYYDNPGNSKDVDGWVLSEKGIHSPDSIVGLSIASIFEKNNQDIAFLTYNDQPPVGPTVDGGGHSKGIIVTSLASGFWIQHSVPHFPLILPSSPNYTYPSTGKNNGQVLHCISLPSTKDVDDLGKIFEITKPHVVNSSFPTDSLKQALPQLKQIVDKKRSPYLENSDRVKTNDDNPCANEIDGCLIKQLKKKNWDQLEIRSANGRVLQAYAKGPSFNEDIYSSQLAPSYKTPLVVQSWLNGPHPFDSNCSSVLFPVHNIHEKSIAGHEFSTHNDHSKWALSGNSDKPLVCISDLNRMEHQLKRGGVAVCFVDPRVWLTFNKSIIDVQPCPRLDLSEAEEQKGLTSSSSTISPVTGLGRDYHNDDDDDDIQHHTSYLRKVASRSYSFAQRLVRFVYNYTSNW